MMPWVRDMSLRRRLTIVIVVTSAIVLSLACVTLALFEVLDFRNAMVRDSTALADILAKNAQAALAFQDADAARDLLQALRAEPHVVAARLYDHAGAAFADYARSGAAAALPAAPQLGAPSFSSDRLELVRPVILDGKTLGSLYLQLDLQGMYDRLARFGIISTAVLLGAIALALVLSAQLQKPISGPVLALAEIARGVAERKDYSMRAPPQGRNEVGVLTDAFNQMLMQIQAQNQALKEGEERVRAVLNCALSAVVVIDAGGRVIDWNAKAESMFGRTRAEALGTDLAAAIIPERLREAHRAGLRRYLSSGTGTVVGQLVEMSALRRDGAEFPVELSISPLRTGEVVTFCGFVTDITERKQAELRVQAQISRLDLLSRIARAIGERQDLASIFQVVIRSLEEDLPLDFGCMCLYDPGRAVLTVTSVGANSARLAEELAMPINGTFPVGANGLAQCVNGKLIYEPDVAQVRSAFPERLARAGLSALVATPLVVESKVFGVLIAARRQANSFSSGECEFLRQLGEQVALAAHQSQLHDSLQRAYDDLRQTQQSVMQQERLRALGQMASGIAHDINNAISPVALYTESLLEKEPNLSARARGYLETIKRAIEDVADTVARMREFYRQREGQLALVPVDLNEMAAQVLELSRARWSDMPQQRGIMIETRSELAAGLPVIQGIASEVREALINLVFNAADAMPDGGTLTLRTRFLEPGTNRAGQPTARRLCIEVVDTGIGMDEETQRRCLEPFYTTKGERGTGLGLAMVYGVAQRHGADIEIDSAVGQGTTMRLAFPIPVVAPADAVAAKVYAVPSRLRILVVDDDPILLKSLSDILDADGHQVTAANLGQAGIDAFRAALASSTPYDVVITDLGMPYVDGRKVAQSVKSASSTTPVILLTGWGQRLIAEGDIPPHVDCVLSKPPKLDELRGALARHRPHPTPPFT